MVKKLPAMWETQVGSLGREDQIPWRRKWQPTPVFLPVEFHGQRCLDSYSPWGFKESDTTERLTYTHPHTHTHTHTHTPLRWPPKFHYRLGGVPIRIPIYFFIEIHKLIQTFTWKFQGLIIVRTILKRKDKIGENTSQISKLTTKLS